MRLGIISTMSAAEAWGGSEELRFATALAALNRGDAPAIRLPQAILKRKKLDRLRQAEAGAFSYDAARQTPKLLKRFELANPLAYSGDIVVMNDTICENEATRTRLRKKSE